MNTHWPQLATLSRSCNAFPHRFADGSQDISSSTVWLSLTLDGEVFDEAEKFALQPLTDWRIVVSAPLVIENTLPIAGSYIVWEQPEVRAAIAANNMLP